MVWIDKRRIILKLFFPIVFLQYIYSAQLHLAIMLLACVHLKLPNMYRQASAGPPLVSLGKLGYFTCLASHLLVLSRYTKRHSHLKM